MTESKAIGVLKVSVVIPCYYSEKTIARVVCATRDELLRAGYDYEFILVNDGSADATFAEISRLSQEDGAIKGIDLMRNFGQHNAIMAGLREVSGDWVMLMDDDMQTHPSQCPLLLDKMSEGFDVVFAEYFQHKESCLRRAGSRFAMWSIRVLAGCPKNITDSNFFIMTRQVCDELTRYESPRVYVQGLIFRTTNRIANVGVEHFDRDQGASGYTLKSLIDHPEFFGDAAALVFFIRRLVWWGGSGGRHHFVCAASGRSGNAAGLGFHHGGNFGVCRCDHVLPGFCGRIRRALVHG
ncbi:MAG: glycosyltransferase family 2 protein, partial [Raoultibacter sp.]